MATLIENLKTRKKAIGVILADMSATTAGGIPNYTAPNGQSFDHVGYRTSLYAELQSINQQLALEEHTEIFSEVVT